MGTPNDSATGSPVCNVYVASDNMDFKLPTDVVIKRAGYFHHPNYPPGMKKTPPIELSRIAGDSEYCDPNTNSMPEPHDELMPSFNPTSKSQVFFGSNNLSWRELMKRYTLSNVDGTITGTNTWGDHSLQYFSSLITFMDQPTYPGFDPISSQSLGDGTIWPSNTPYTNNNGGILQWVCPMYAGMRGSFRKKAISTASIASQNSSTNLWANVTDNCPLIFTHNRTYPYENTYDGRNDTSIANETDTYPIVMQEAYKTNRDYLGSNVSNNNHNNVLETEVPFYVPYRFKDPRIVQITQGFSSEAGGPTPYRYHLSGVLPIISETDIQATTSVSVYTATAEDFNLYWRLSTFPIWDKASQKL